jgi:hypothetical protein
MIILIPVIIMVVFLTFVTCNFIVAAVTVLATSWVLIFVAQTM